MRLLPLLIATLCCGCRPDRSSVDPALARPAELRDGGAFFDGGTVVLEFVGRDGRVVEVYLPPEYPAFQRVVGRPFFLNNHPEAGGRKVELGSVEEEKIIAALKRFRGDPKTALRVREFLEAARTEAYLAARPALLMRREELHDALLAAHLAATTLPSSSQTEDETEYYQREQAMVEAKLVIAETRGRWKEFNSLVKALATK